MDRDHRPAAGRNGVAPPAYPGAEAAAVSRRTDNGQKWSMLHPFMKFRRSYVPDKIRASQVNVFSRLKGLKSSATLLNPAQDVNKIESSLVSPLLALSDFRPPPYLPPDSQPLEVAGSSDVVTTVEQMQSQAAPGSQKRKQADEHGDAPERSKAKSLPLRDNREDKPKSLPWRDNHEKRHHEKRHIVQQWVNQQDRSIAASVKLLSEGDVPLRCSSPLPIRGAGAESTGNDHPLIAANRPLSIDFSGLGRVFQGRPLHRASTWKDEHELPDTSSSPPPLVNDERRGSTATTTNLTYRDSIFSTCPSVGTGLTSPSEISLVLTAARCIKAESRASSLFSSRASRRSSIASTSPHFILNRTPSSNSAGGVEDLDELLRHPLPNLRPINPLRWSHPTFLGMDLGNAQTAVVIDQGVKMGHVAQERRVNPGQPVDVTAPPNDTSSLLSAATVIASTDLAPITETASDDGALSGSRILIHPPETQSPREEACVIVGETEHIKTPDTKATSNPSTPRSTDQVSDAIDTEQRLDNQTPATSMTGVSDITMNDPASPLSDESDDGLSDVTDYTEESFFSAVEAFGPELYNPLLLSIIVALKDDVTRLVLSRVISMLGDGNGVTQHTNNNNSNNNTQARGSSSRGSSSNNSAANRRTAVQRTGSRKRELDGEGDGFGEDDDDRGKRPKPTLAIPSDLESRYRRLACPFFKRYPATKWNRACCGPGYATVHRLKEHIYRKHEHPYCQRCHATFANEKELEAHLQADIPCTVVKGPLGHQGITPEQRKLMKSRQKSNGDTSKSEPEKWAELYLLLFPEVLKEDIPSPYYDLKSCEELINPATAAAFRAFLDEDLPNRVEHQLEERLRLIPGAESDFVQVQLRDIIKACLREALDHVPAQLLAREGTAEPVEVAAGIASPAEMGDSHNRAQIGAQFETVLLQQRGQMPARFDGAGDDAEEEEEEVTLLPGPENNRVQQYHSQYHPQQAWPLPDTTTHDDHIGSIFGRGYYFPDPPLQAPPGLGAGFGNVAAAAQQHHPQPPAPTMMPFTTIGFPSAMIAGDEGAALSPALLPQSMGGHLAAFDALDFADVGRGNAVVGGGGGLGGNLTNMPNVSFLYTSEEGEGQQHGFGMG